MIEIAEGVYIEGDLPVIYLKPLNSIVLSDVHIGYEEEMARKGIFLPRVQRKRFINIIDKSIEIFKTNNIIIDGDLKHIFNGLGKQEKDDLNYIFEYAKQKEINITIVKGNHDNYLSIVADKYDINMVDEIKNQNYIIFHGHKNIDSINEESIYIIGHEHPRISLRDKLGFARKLQCFLVVPLKNNSKVVVLPALGIYQSGNDVSLIHSNYMSPIIRNFGILEKAKPYVIIENEGIMEFPELNLLKNIVV
ncbi:phosphoesterase [Acidianus sulfidivorans JP7]|uniref:Phosphoesterase n=1 Tax=Acidianus sulfidivorans JP7 TaxID=619593 RepID=A0A2U9IQL9_9CREN|nr:metallophosphoesterase [Acidianus sulfidivorans]AWR98320.1 phosphoesterase [Acidianus sulfidivorans JP7]